jgi:hypothetical protein
MKPLGILIGLEPPFHIFSAVRPNRFNQVEEGSGGQVFVAAQPPSEGLEPLFPQFVSDGMEKQSHTVIQNEPVFVGADLIGRYSEDRFFGG